MQYSLTTLEGISQPKYFYLVEQIHLCTQKKAILGWFTAVERGTLVGIPDKLIGADAIKVEDSKEVISLIADHPTLHVPKSPVANVFDLDKTSPLIDAYVYGTIPVNDTSLILIKIAEDSTEPPYRMTDEFYITGGMIENYKGGDMLTDVGKFFLNQLLFVDPFGDKIPYLNDIFVPKKVDSMVAALLVKKAVGRKEYDKYINNGYWFGEDGSIATQGLSEKALGTDPAIAKRKEELLTQYKDHLDDPVVIAKIEKELIDMDKAYIKGDSSEPFFMAAGGKAYKEQRKKMFIMFGMSEDFVKVGHNIKFTRPSLEEGFTPENLPNIANEIRRGSYGRGIKTADGGTESKFMLRFAQDVKIVEDDCGSKRGIRRILTEKLASKMMDRWLTDGTVLTPDNYKQYLGKVVEFRAPQYCKSKGGYCYACHGKIFKDLKIKNSGLQCLSITEGFIGTAMASMHNSSVSTIDVGDIGRFIRYIK